jgi:hypothetical protein
LERAAGLWRFIRQHRAMRKLFTVVYEHYLLIVVVRYHQGAGVDLTQRLKADCDYNQKSCPANRYIRCVDADARKDIVDNEWHDRDEAESD